MKKTLALVLAVMMLATVAFAVLVPAPAKSGTQIPGGKIKLEAGDFYKDLLDNSTDYLANGGALVAGVPKGGVINTDKVTINSISWSKGKTLVGSVVIDDDDEVVYVKLKKDYMTTKESDLIGTVKIREKSTPKNTYIASIEYTIYNTLDKTVGNVNGTAYFAERNDEVSIKADDDTVGVVKGVVFKMDCDEASGILILEGDDFEVNVRVYDGEKFNVFADTSNDEAVLKANADVDADYINFINFVASPTFTSNATITFFCEEDDNVYELKNGKLTKANVKWSEDVNGYTLKARTLGTYVISDGKLITSAATTTTDNPDTGANDVVGIATAMAVVALVSAAAISLKK